MVDIVVSKPLHAVMVRQEVLVLVAVVLELWSGKTDVTKTTSSVHCGNVLLVEHGLPSSGYGGEQRQHPFLDRRPAYFLQPINNK